MQVLQWAASYPQRVFAALPIAAATRHSAQNIAFHEVGRQAVMADPDWRGGRYFAYGTSPRRGLAVARMAAHITYLSDAALHRKFGRRFQNRDNPTFSFDADFPGPTTLALFSRIFSTIAKVNAFPLADTLDRFLTPGWQYSHLPFGEHRKHGPKTRASFAAPFLAASRWCD